MIMWLPGITQAHILVSKLWRSKSRGGKLRMVAVREKQLKTYCEMKRVLC